MFAIADSPIDREALIRSLSENKAGGFVAFEGWVRDHNQGKSVASLEYQIYPELAQKEGDKVLREAKQKFNLHDIQCVHRFGHLHLGDIAVWVGATASHRDDAFKATRYVIDEIKHRLPIWKKEHYKNSAAEWVFCRDHHTHVHFHEKDYYRKQAKIVAQPLLKRARVLVVGAGGLGCPVLSALAAAGVGHIHIADFDKIEISNIHRQPLYSPDLVGERKAVVAQRKLAQLNPFIEVRGVHTYVSAENVEELFTNQDLVIDCSDNLRTKFLLHDAAFKFATPLLSASIYKAQGQVRTFVPKLYAGCLRCTYSQTPTDDLIGNCNDFGVTAAGVATIGSLQASEALQFLQTQKNNTIYDSFYFDLATLSQMKIRNIKLENCECCQGKVDLHKDDFEIDAKDVTADFEMVDIRDAHEDVLKKYSNSTKKIAVVCNRGVKSLRAVRDLRAQGYTHFYSVRGGSCSL